MLRFHFFSGSFSKDINFIVKIFWPYRSKVKGFSIENVDNKYRGKIYSLPSNKNTNQCLGDRNLKSMNIDINYIENSSKGEQRGHWANRDFSEYREAA